MKRMWGGAAVVLIAAGTLVGCSSGPSKDEACRDVDKATVPLSDNMANIPEFARLRASDGVFLEAMNRDLDALRDVQGPEEFTRLRDTFADRVGELTHEGLALIAKPGRGVAQVEAAMANVLVASGDLQRYCAG